MALKRGRQGQPTDLWRPQPWHRWFYIQPTISNSRAQQLQCMFQQQSALPCTAHALPGCGGNSLTLCTVPSGGLLNTGWCRTLRPCRQAALAATLQPRYMMMSSGPDSALAQAPSSALPSTSWHASLRPCAQSRPTAGNFSAPPLLLPLHGTLPAFHSQGACLS